jgi:hypothetical protein
MRYFDEISSRQLSLSLLSLSHLELGSFTSKEDAALGREIAGTGPIGFTMLEQRGAELRD